MRAMMERLMLEGLPALTPEQWGRIISLLAVANGGSWPTAEDLDRATRILADALIESDPWG